MEHLGTFSKDRIEKLAQETQRRTEAREDFVVARQNLAVIEGEKKGDLVLTIAGKTNGGGDRWDSYPLRRSTLVQVASSVKVPVKYLDRLINSGHGDLAALNLAEILQREDERKHLVRVLDGKADAFLSDRYRAIANDDVLAVCLEEFEKAGVELWDLELTDDEFRVLAAAPHISGQVTTDRNFTGMSRWEGREGDVLNAAITVKNSETGHGAFSGHPSILRRVCQNFCIWADGVCRVHLGKELEEGEQHFTSEETRTLEDAALVSKLRDVIRTTFNPEKFAKVIDAINQTTTREFGEASATQVVDAAVRVFNLGEGRKEAILEKLLKSGDRSQYGAVQAITAQVNPENVGDLADEVRASYEDAGGKLLRYGESAWKKFIKEALNPTKKVESEDEEVEQRQTVSVVR